MYIGCAYYPEYWPEERWPEDIKLMKEIGFNVIRLAEYAWVKMEPEEGLYVFGWLDRIINLCEANGIKVILGTPTDSMPAWVAEKYPDALSEKEDGTRVLWGGRKNNCYSSEHFNRLSRKIASEMAQHYKDNPTVIGWQIGNEYGPPESRSGSQRKQFQLFLKEKYKHLDNLNEKWGNAFWGHTFTSWEQIPVPLYWRFNPSMSLEWKRFHTGRVCEHQAGQIEEIRKFDKKRFITHNFIGHHTVLDYPKLAEQIDFVSWDNYPIEESHSIMIKASLCGDLMRGMKKMNYWIMEQATGMISVMWEGMVWEQYRNAYENELRKIAFQQVAHGADGMLWFRWRATTTGREQYLNGLIGQDGKSTRRFYDIQRATKDIRLIENELKSTTIQAKVAIVFDYESEWANYYTPVYKQNNYFDRILTYYKALFHAGVNVDVIRPGDDFNAYALVLAPDLVILRDADAESLNDYVNNGGVLFADARTGEKDEYNRIHQRRLPGLLSQSLGIEIDDVSCMYEDMLYHVKGNFLGEETFTIYQYCEWVRSVNADNMLMYNNWQMDGYSLLTRNKYGKGQGWYLGGIVKEDAFYDKLIEKLLEAAIVKPLLKLPRGVEISVRENDEKRILFVINHNDKSRDVDVGESWRDLINGQMVKDNLSLERYGIRILLQEK